jgi:hypothetical protein
MVTFIKSFCFLIITLGLAAFLIFNLATLIVGDNPYRSVVHISMPFTWYNFRELDSDPLPYLATIVTISSIIGALWVAFIIPKYPKHIFWQVLVIPWLSVVLTSPFWGFIWSINLRSPQWFGEYFPNDPSALMWPYYRHDALGGLMFGWLSALQSFPVNILSYIAFCSLLLATYQIFTPKITSKNDIAS